LLDDLQILRVVAVKLRELTGFLFDGHLLQQRVDAPLNGRISFLLAPGRTSREENQQERRSAETKHLQPPNVIATHHPGGAMDSQASVESRIRAIGPVLLEQI